MIAAINYTAANSTTLGYSYCVYTITTFTPPGISPASYQNTVLNSAFLPSNTQNTQQQEFVYICPETMANTPINTQRQVIGILEPAGQQSVQQQAVSQPLEPQHSTPRSSVSGDTRDTRAAYCWPARQPSTR